jgi:alkylation response protein AidB-like acyl-CoA dehydrogenase
VFPFSERFSYQTSLYQLVLTAVQAGIAKAVERDVVLQVTTRSRAFSHGNSPLTREDPQILEIVGRVSVDAFTAEAAVEHAAVVLQRAYDLRGEVALAARAKEAAELASARAQIVTTEVSLRAATQLFDALGASATSTSVALDRHWRNARTVASHNPTAFKARIIGDNLVNRAEPPYEWYVGVGKKK